MDFTNSSLVIASNLVIKLLVTKDQKKLTHEREIDIQDLSLTL